MSDNYKFKFEYELLQDDENLDDDNKIRFTTYGNTAKEAIENHAKILHAWHKFLEKEAKKTSLKKRINLDNYSHH
jgi:hypothetical protein